MAGHARHPHDPPWTEHADVLVAGEDAGVQQGSAHATSAGEIEPVQRGDVEVLGAGNAFLLKGPFRLEGVRGAEHVGHRLAEGEHAVGPGVQEDGVEEGWSYALGPRVVDEQLDGDPGLIQGDIVRRPEIDVGRAVQQGDRQEPPGFELLEETELPCRPGGSASRIFPQRTYRSPAATNRPAPVRIPHLDGTP